MKKYIDPNACGKQQAMTPKHYTRTIVRVLIAGVIAGAAIAPSNALAQAEPKVLGKTIGEWSAEWWKWAFAIPALTNPMLGGDCEQGQQGPVWFLAGVWLGGTDHERSCNVPRGKHILFPITNSFWIQTLQDQISHPEYTETDYRRLANDFLPPSVGGDLEATLEKATLDPTPIIFNPNTPIIRSQSPVFTASFPPDNLFKYSFGLDLSEITGRPIVSDGFWVMLPPLSPGKYTLHFRAGDAQNVTYELTIK
jgi:hypothetical protein